MEHFIEPVRHYDEETYHSPFIEGLDAEHISHHFESPEHHEREIEYILDRDGHVHTFEEVPRYYHSFLQ